MNRALVSNFKSVIILILSIPYFILIFQYHSSLCSNNNNVCLKIVSIKQSNKFVSNFESLKNQENQTTIIYIITPTYRRPTQIADLTRLSQTLQLVPDIFWILVEDSHRKSRQIESLLERSKIPYAHLLGPRPQDHLDEESGRGVSNRLKALEWIQNNFKNVKSPKGVIYFADDDNTYDVRLFDEIRSTRLVSMFPVGLVNTFGISSPIVDRKSGKIIDFYDSFKGDRKFSIDMAGFAVGLQYYLQRSQNATMPYEVGYEEDGFLISLGVKMYQLEPKAQNCTQVLVWHTKTEAGPSLDLQQRKLSVDNYRKTNLPLLYERLIND